MSARIPREIEEIAAMRRERDATVSAEDLAKRQAHRAFVDSLPTLLHPLTRSSNYRQKLVGPLQRFVRERQAIRDVHALEYLLREELQQARKDALAAERENTSARVDKEGAVTRHVEEDASGAVLDPTAGHTLLNAFKQRYGKSLDNMQDARERADELANLYDLVRAHMQTLPKPTGDTD